MAYLISDSRIDLELAERVGKGWSAYLVPLHRIERIQRVSKSMIAAVITSIAFLAISIANKLIERSLSSTSNANSAVVITFDLALMVAALIGLVGVTVIVDRLYKNLKFRLKGNPPLR
jgi:hypothetical protein